MATDRNRTSVSDDSQVQQIRIAHGCIRGTALPDDFKGNHTLAVDGKPVEVGWTEHWQREREGGLRDFRLRLPSTVFDGEDHRFELRLDREETTVFDRVVGARHLHLNRFESIARVEHGTELTGWVQSVKDPATPLRVVLTEDGQQIGTVDANETRPWVNSKYNTPPSCGFSFDLAAGYLGREQRRFALRIKGTSIPLVNSPFSLDYRTAARSMMQDLHDSNRRSRQILWGAMQVKS